jgi:hypothetical protein
MPSPTRGGGTRASMRASMHTRAHTDRRARKRARARARATGAEYLTGETMGDSDFVARQAKMPGGPARELRGRAAPWRNPAIALQIRAGPSRSRPIRETHFQPIILGRQFANGDASTNDAASVPRQAILVARPERQPEVAQSDFRLSSAHHDRDRSIAFEKGHRWPAIAGRPSRIAGCRR